MRIEVLPGVVIDPASVVLFPITTIVVLLTYIELDAEETRKVAYGVVISNLAVYAVAAVAGWHLVLDGHRNPLDLPVTLFTQSLRLALVSTFALFVDVVSALVVFEAISRRLRASLFRRLWLTLAVVMAVDSVLFYGGVFFGRPGWLGMVASAFFAKLAGATFYAAFVALYVRYIDPRRARRRRRSHEPRRLHVAHLPPALRRGAGPAGTRRPDRALQPRLLRRARAAAGRPRRAGRHIR